MVYLFAITQKQEPFEYLFVHTHASKEVIISFWEFWFRKTPVCWLDVLKGILCSSSTECLMSKFLYNVKYIVWLHYSLNTLRNFYIGMAKPRTSKVSRYLKWIMQRIRSIFLTFKLSRHWLKLVWICFGDELDTAADDFL